MNILSTILEINLTYSPIINFAMQQNHVPVIRKLTIKNIGGSDLNNIQIQIIPELEFAVEPSNFSAHHVHKNLDFHCCIIKK